MALKVGNLSLERLRIANLYSAYFGMTPREQTIALVAAVAVLLLIIVLPVAVASGRIGKLESDVSDGKKQFREIMRAIESYDQKKARLAQTQQMLAGGFDPTLSSTIESIAESNGMKDKIDSLKEKPSAPSETFDESSVDVRLKKLSLQQAVDFLYAIEHQPDKVLRLKQLSIKTRYDNKQDLDVSFTVSTFKLLEGAAEGA
ncbi:MAG: hypothetical protein V2A66_10440 [Pseudomonadota bacterium]